MINDTIKHIPECEMRNYVSNRTAMLHKQMIDNHKPSLHQMLREELNKQQKENQMEINLNTIGALAKQAVKSTTDEFDQVMLNGMGGEMAAVIEEAMAEERKEATKRAAMQVMEIFKGAQLKKETLVNDIRALRRKEAELKSVLSKIERAVAYGSSTQNYLPLANEVFQLGSSAHRQYGDLLKVPETFQQCTAMSATKPKK